MRNRHLLTLAGILTVLAAVTVEAALPVITLRHESGQRYQYDLLGEDDDLFASWDEITFDGYTFHAGYGQVQQAILKGLEFKARFDYNLKNYDTASNRLENDAYAQQVWLTWEIVRNLKVSGQFRHTYRTYPYATEKDSEGFSPRVEVRWSPARLLHLGANYSLVREDYLRRANGDNWYHRANLWYEHRVLPPLHIRLRYRFEHRDFDVNPSANIRDSFRHAFSATARLDLNNLRDRRRVRLEEGGEEEAEEWP